MELMMDRVNIVTFFLGGIICGASTYGMWEHLPEALFGGSRSWQARDAIFWKFLFYTGVIIMFVNGRELYKNWKS